MTLIRDHESIAYCLPTTLIYSKGDSNEALNSQNSPRGTPNRYKTISLVHRWTMVSFLNFCRANFKIIYCQIKLLIFIVPSVESMKNGCLLCTDCHRLLTLIPNPHDFHFCLVENKRRWLFSIKMWIGINSIKL